MSVKNSQRSNNNAKRVERLNINRLPSTVTGVPAEMFHHFTVEIIITGTNSVTRQIRPHTADGKPGKPIPYDEAMKLSRAAGFVQAHSKEESRSELTELTRALFFNSKLDVTKVKDPKIFSKMITGYEENLQKTKASLLRAGEGIEDQEAKKFLATMLKRATNSLNDLIADRASGGNRPESEIFHRHRFPSSLKSKFLSGHFEVAPQGQLWTSLYGKEMHRFCNLTVAELNAGFADDDVFYPSKKAEELKKLIQPKNLAEMSGYPDWKSTPEKTKERILAYQFPIILPVRKVEFFRRYATTKAQISSKNPIEGVWPILDLAYNLILRDEYYQPPRDMSKLKEFWSGVAGKQLYEPHLAAKDYRVQAIEALDEKATEEKLLDRAYFTGPIADAMIGPIPLRFAKLVKGTYRGPDGAEVKIEEGYDKYLPYEIIGPVKKVRKKDQMRKQGMRKSRLTKRSKQLVSELSKEGVSPPLIAEIKEYLCSFVNLQFQEMAANIVYVTSEATVREARMHALGEEPEDYDSPDGENSEDDDDDSGKGAQEENKDEVVKPLPPKM